MVNDREIQNEAALEAFDYRWAFFWGAAYELTQAIESGVHWYIAYQCKIAAEQCDKDQTRNIHRQIDRVFFSAEVVLLGVGAMGAASLAKREIGRRLYPNHLRQE